MVKANEENVQKDFREKYRELTIESKRGKPNILITWENRVYRGRDIMSRGQGEICKEETSIRREKVEMILEEDPSLGDIIGESQ